MGIFADTDWGCIKKLLKPVELVLDYDLERLKRIDKVKRIEMWNNIASSQEKFEEKICGDIERDIQEEISGKLSLAKLMLATAAYVANEDTSIIKQFNETELNLLKDLERYVAFEILSVDESAGRIGRKEAGLYELITEYYEKGYYNLDKILDDPSIIRDLKVALKNRYVKNQKKIKEITVACIERYGLSWLKTSILAKVKESELKREEIFRDAQQKIEKLENELKSYEPLEAENLVLKDKISELDAKLVGKEIEHEAAQKILSTLESDKNRLDQKYSEMGRLLDSQMQSIEEKRRELDGKTAELEKDRQQYKEKAQEENQRIVENELEKIALLKNELQNKENSLLAEKQQAELKKNELSEKLNQITDVMKGKPLRFAAREDAKLYELNYIARFDTKMHNFPLKLYNPLERKNYIITSWESHYRFDSREEVFYGENINYAETEAKNPLNARSVYLVEEKRFKLFGEKIKKTAIEAVSYNRLRDYADYGFDTNRATLSEFLMLLSKSINNAEIGKYLHVIGIASPTGWDERVIQEISSKEFAHNYVSRYVSVCLIDSVTGDVYYNPTDDRIAGFIDFFKPEFDREKVERVKKHVLEKFKLKDYAVFSDVLEET
ncbi:MAG: hypothetical protein KJ714_08440, partial [Euryarchaeota archaeon]|nr:hypothetical protein [Euryarchaeota archaeon]